MCDFVGDLQRQDRPGRIDAPPCKLAGAKVHIVRMERTSRSAPGGVGRPARFVKAAADKRHLPRIRQRGGNSLRPGLLQAEGARVEGHKAEVRMNGKVYCLTARNALPQSHARTGPDDWPRPGQRRLALYLDDAFFKRLRKVDVHHDAWAAGRCWRRFPLVQAGARRPDRGVGRRRNQTSVRARLDAAL